MHPTICTIGPFTVYSYGLMLVVAFMAGTTLAGARAKAEGLNPDIIFNLAFSAFVCGIIGARIFFVVENLGYYLLEPLEIIMLQHGGMSWFGGLALGSLSAFIYLKIKRQPVFKILDLVAPYLALAQAIGRIGCLLNGCCYGRESVLGIYFPAQEAVLIPTQVVSSVALVLIFLILRFFQDRPHRQGEVLLAYLLLYSVKRFLVEFWRADNPVILGSLTLFQVLSIAVFCASLAGLVFIRNSKRKP